MGGKSWFKRPQMKHRLNGERKENCGAGKRGRINLKTAPQFHRRPRMVVAIKCQRTSEVKRCGYLSSFGFPPADFFCASPVIGTKRTGSVARFSKRFPCLRSSTRS